MPLSWPIAFGGGYEYSMSGFDNIRFIARVYNRPMQETIDYVDNFAEFGKQLYLPVKNYSWGMRARLTFALTPAVKFHCYLIDEVMAAGDQSFHKKCHDTIFVQRQHCAMILVSHDLHVLKSYCSKALVLKNGCGRVFDDFDPSLSI
jgi:capsular polysaccharide transport system ATP-binding protein